MEPGGARYGRRGEAWTDESRTGKVWSGMAWNGRAYDLED
jgi:hypothetical protein